MANRAQQIGNVLSAPDLIRYSLSAGTGAPGASGQALLAHELTHVAQAKQGLHRKGTFDGQMAFTEEHEHEAHEVEHEVESGVHPEGQGASRGAAAAQAAKQASEKAMKENIEKIKARVIELMGEAARNHYVRNGSARRP